MFTLFCLDGTDDKGTLILETGKMLQRYKYRIKVLNMINFNKSMKYNPFAYLRSEKDILKLPCFIFFTLLHFTVHLSILDMSTHIIVLTVIEHIICSLSIAIIRKSV